jgi:hypothetical protein
MMLRCGAAQVQVLTCCRLHLAGSCPYRPHRGAQMPGTEFNGNAVLSSTVLRSAKRDRGATGTVQGAHRQLWRIVTMRVPLCFSCTKLNFILFV